MLYMTILTWDPDRRDAVLDRVRKMGLEHEGMKVIGTWADFSGGRCFQLSEIPQQDPAISLKANFAWNDILRIESVPVMNAMDMMNMLSTLQKPG